MQAETAIKLKCSAIAFIRFMRISSEMPTLSFLFANQTSQFQVSHRTVNVRSLVICWTNSISSFETIIFYLLMENTVFKENEDGIRWEIFQLFRAVSIQIWCPSDFFKSFEHLIWSHWTELNFTNKQKYEKRQTVMWTNVIHGWEIVNFMLFILCVCV